MHALLILRLFVAAGGRGSRVVEVEGSAVVAVVAAAAAMW
jgi:hypothetical protein